MDVKKIVLHESIELWLALSNVHFISEFTFVPLPPPPSPPRIAICLLKKNPVFFLHTSSSSKEKLLKCQENSSWLIISVILMTSLIDDHCWGLKEQSH